jgi:predicted lipoprotein with Yx(FWY)xxD motif
MRIAIYAAVLALAATPAFAEAPKSGTTSAGPTLVDAKGMTLYTFDKDAAGKSNCNGGCATNWPPAAAAASDKASGDFTLVTRDDGAKQWAHKGKPLYTWAKDKKAGDAGGGTVASWHVAKP